MELGFKLLHLLVANLVAFGFAFQKHVLFKLGGLMSPLVALAFEKQLSVLLAFLLDLLHDFALLTGLLRDF